MRADVKEQILLGAVIIKVVWLNLAAIEKKVWKSSRTVRYYRDSEHIVMD